jgi:hypothetical protein
MRPSKSIRILLMEQDTPENTPVIFNKMWLAAFTVALTAVAYALAFSYETGYAEYFHLPSRLINISPTVISDALNLRGDNILALLFVIVFVIVVFSLPSYTTPVKAACRQFVRHLIVISLLFAPFLEFFSQCFHYLSS